MSAVCNCIHELSKLALRHLAKASKPASKPAEFVTQCSMQQLVAIAIRASIVVSFPSTPPSIECFVCVCVCVFVSIAITQANGKLKQQHLHTQSLAASAHRKDEKLAIKANESNLNLKITRNFY